MLKINLTEDQNDKLSNLFRALMDEYGTPEQEYFEEDEGGDDLQNAMNSVEDSQREDNVMENLTDMLENLDSIDTGEVLSAIVLDREEIPDTVILDMLKEITVLRKVISIIINTAENISNESSHFERMTFELLNAMKTILVRAINSNDMSLIKQAVAEMDNILGIGTETKEQCHCNKHGH